MSLVSPGLVCAALQVVLSLGAVTVTATQAPAYGFINCWLVACESGLLLLVHRILLDSTVPILYMVYSQGAAALITEYLPRGSLW